ncbi:14524_t:CDS:2, partial [Racocetra persica]
TIYNKRIENDNKFYPVNTYLQLNPQIDPNDVFKESNEFGKIHMTTKYQYPLNQGRCWNCNRAFSHECCTASDLKVRTLRRAKEYDSADYTKIFLDIFSRDLLSYPLLKQAEKVSNQIDTTELDIYQFTDSERKLYKSLEEKEPFYKAKIFLLKNLEKQVKEYFPDKYEKFAQNINDIKTVYSIQHHRIYDKINEAKFNDAFTKEEIEKFLEDREDIEEIEKFFFMKHDILKKLEEKARKDVKRKRLKFIYHG